MLQVPLLLAVASAAWAAPASASDRALANANAHLDKGLAQLVSVRSTDNKAMRLQTLDRAIWFLRQSLADVKRESGAEFTELRRGASQALVRALDAEADIHWQRKSLALATNRAVDALTIDSSDAFAWNILDMVADWKATDVYTNASGQAAIDRIRGRRAAAGLPLRDRGVATRR
jgi:hypothetical protein